MTTTIKRSRNGDHWVWSVKVQADGNTVLRAEGAAWTRRAARERVDAWVRLFMATVAQQE